MTAAIIITAVVVAAIVGALVLEAWLRESNRRWEEDAAKERERFLRIQAAMQRPKFKLESSGLRMGPLYVSLARLADTVTDAQLEHEFKDIVFLRRDGPWQMLRVGQRGQFLSVVGPVFMLAGDEIPGVTWLRLAQIQPDGTIPLDLFDDIPTEEF